MATEEKSGKGPLIALIITMAIVAVLFLITTTSFNSNPASTNSTSISVPSNPSPSNNAQPNIRSQNIPQPQVDSSQITAADIAPYLTGVVEIVCKKMDANGVSQINDTGSGSLWSFSNGTYDVVTNEHVIAGDNMCVMWIPNSNGTKQGTYYLGLSETKDWNSIADEAVIPIVSASNSTGVYTNGVGIDNAPLSQLNYSISSLQNCPANMPPNSPVTIIGFPAFSSINTQGNLYGAFKNQITTNGVISGNYSLPQNNTLPYSDYYISATIDSGNSGGIALSKNADGLCLLGIPTWITLTGNFNNEGIVQNINNVKYVFH